MANVIFYEKPGCASNARQKALLLSSGHRLEVRDLLSEPWSASSLRPYFAAKPVREWFNAASPRVKSGEIDPDALNPQEAIVMMILDPGLIRRPLMRIGDHCESGFDPVSLRRWIGLRAEDDGVTERCAMDAA
jgi:nitrogenase-associated protein